MGPSSSNYDCVIIGAGMSGLAAAIRLGMFGKKALVLEKHAIAGGLNSYYQKFNLEFDVGLHALTNYAHKSERRRPLTKLLKQLRIPYDQLDLIPQKSSRIQFGSTSLNFNNQLDYFITEIEKQFPHQMDGFIQLVNDLDNYDETNLQHTYRSAKKELTKYFSEPLLIEMICAPLLIYGSAWENDMDFSQFAIMFKSIYREGFSRPRGGVRTIINLLLDKCAHHNIEVRFKSAVKQITKISQDNIKVTLKNGDVIQTKKILSSAGFVETMNLLGDHNYQNDIGKLSFSECLFIGEKKPSTLGFDSTILFYNQDENYHYHRPNTLYDSRSAVVCLPNNYSEDEFEQAWYRITYISNYSMWTQLERQSYKAQKELMLKSAKSLINQLTGHQHQFQYTDCFTPKTITKFTSHLGGCVYGSPQKSRMGLTKHEGVYLMGTDQGFLGIIGSMLSGVSMANLHVLQAELP